MQSFIYSHFKSRRLFRFWLSTSVIVLSGLFCQLVFAKTASADPAPSNAIHFQTAKSHNGDVGWVTASNYTPGTNGFGGGDVPTKILSENSFELNLKYRWGDDNPAFIRSFNAQQYDPQNPDGYSGSLSYYFSLNSLDKKVNFLNAAENGTYSTLYTSISYKRVAWTENFIEYKIDQSEINDWGRNSFGFVEPIASDKNSIFEIRSSCANPAACDMIMNLTAQPTRLSDASTPNDGKSKNQPLVGLDENGQKLKAFENSSNVDVSGGDYKFAMPGQISSTVGTLGGLFTTLMSANSGSCVLTSYVPWVAPLHSTFGNIVNQNFCPNVDFKGSVLDYARQFSVFVVAFIFAFAIYGIARFLFSEAKEWGTPQSGGTK